MNNNVRRKHDDDDLVQFIEANTRTLVAGPSIYQIRAAFPASISTLSLQLARLKREGRIQHQGQGRGFIPKKGD